MEQINQTKQVKQTERRNQIVFESTEASGATQLGEDNDRFEKKGANQTTETKQMKQLKHVNKMG